MSSPENQKHTRNRFVAGGLVGFVVFYLLSMILRSFGNDYAWVSTVLVIASTLGIISLLVAGVGLIYYLIKSRTR